MSVSVCVGRWRDFAMRTFRVYRYQRELNTTVKCNLGCTHSVTFHKMKVLRENDDDGYRSWITALNYPSDGWGTVRVAYDTQGRRYESRPYWDGYSPWIRMVDNERFWTRPTPRLDVAFNLDGRIIR